MDGVVRVTLKRPLELGSTRIEELTFRRGKIGDVKGIPIAAPTVEHLLLVASRLSGQPVGVLEQIDEEDSGPVLEVAARFLGRCLGGGSEPSES